MQLPPPFLLWSFSLSESAVILDVMAAGRLLVFAGGGNLGKVNGSGPIGGMCPSGAFPLMTVHLEYDNGCAAESVLSRSRCVAAGVLLW